MTARGAWSIAARHETGRGAATAMAGWKILLALLPVLGGLLLAAWAALVLALWWQQDRLIFPGWGFHLVSSSGLAPGDERLEFLTPDGVPLFGGLRPARRPSRGLLLVFSGNAEDPDWRLRHLGAFVDDLDVATFYYRGYGPSGGRPGEAALVADAVLAHDQLVARLRPRRVMAAGFSLGSAVVAQLARRRPLDGAVLVTPFDSVAAVAAALYPWVPVRRLLRHPFRSDAALAELDLPVAVIAAERDQVVPPARTKALLAVLKRPVLVAWIAGADHVSLYERAEYRTAFRAALDRLLAESKAQAGSVASGAAAPRLRSIPSHETGRPM